MAVPIQIGDRNLGVLYAYNRAKSRFTQDDLDTLFLLANLSAVEILRKQTEQSLANAERLQRTLLAASPIGIGLMKNRVWEWANEAMHRMLKYEPNELQGKPVRILYPSEEAYEQAGHEVYDDIEQHGFGETTGQWLRKDGTIIDCWIRKALLDPEAIEKGLIAAVLDVTERKRAEEALSRKPLQLEEATTRRPAKWRF